MQTEKVTLDSDAAARLRDATGQLELCDAEGRTLGYFLPPDTYREWHGCREMAYDWAREQFGDDYGPQYPDDGRPPMTTAEANRYLEGVAKSGESAA